MHINVIDTNDDPIPPSRTLNDGDVPKPPPQPRNLRLQSIGRPTGRLLPVQPVNEPLDGNDSSSVQKQHRQQRPHGRPAHRHGRPTHKDLDRPQQAKQHPPILPHRTVTLLPTRSAKRDAYVVA
ncbi:hypothetical protein GCM10022254_72200 [Actinomadura meridiana]|uniref:Uncharacterized protein n=1 Tax=Actinomadura meridiana TaxID=559626 RepID=A0ABP8CQ27_9ACTN